MKVCSECQRQFDDRVHFCTKDGTRLTRIEERGYCRRCGKDYPLSLQQCPLHETPLSEHGPRTIVGDNFCHLCDTDYPKAFKLCPVHGIALQTNPLKKKLLKQIEVPPPPPVLPPPAGTTQPLEVQQRLGALEAQAARPAPRQDHSSAAQLPRAPRQVTLPRAAQSYAPAQDQSLRLDTNEIAEALDSAVKGAALISSPAAIPPTDHLLAAAPVATAVPSVALNAPAQRGLKRRVIPAGLLIVVLLASAGAYQWFDTAAQREAASLTAPGAEHTPAQVPSGKAPASTPQAGKSGQLPPDPRQAAGQLERPAERATGGPLAVHVGTTVAAAVSNANRRPAPVERRAEAERNAAGADNDPGAAAQTDTPPDRTWPIFIPGAPQPQPPAAPPQGEANRTQKPTIRDIFEAPAASADDSASNIARVVPAIRNRRRLAIPGGYRYYFEVALSEVNGVGVTWGRATLLRISDAGLEGVHHSRYDFALAANGRFVFKLEIDLLGTSSRDWKGWVTYQNTGTDEHGHQVPLKFRLRLDENFAALP